MKGFMDRFDVIFCLPFMLSEKEEDRPPALEVASSIYRSREILGESWMCEKCEAWVMEHGTKLRSPESGLTYSDMKLGAVFIGVLSVSLAATFFRWELLFSTV